jgi:hypothetical protein
MSILVQVLEGEAKEYIECGSYGIAEIFQSAAERITELEKENKLLKRVEQIFNDATDLNFSDFERYFPEDFEAHNLEQQAKGLIDYAEALYMNIKRGKYHQLMMAAGRLQIKAKALKEGKQ